MSNHPTVMCKAIRPTTGSTIEVEIPESVARAVDVCGDITIACGWIGKEFNWQFIPLSFTPNYNENHDKN
jgi:hypothetical protein